MTIFCDICQHPITSLQPDPVKAQRYVMETMSAHLMSNHKKEAAEIAQDCICAGYLCIRRYMRIPDAEQTLIATLNQAEESFIEAIREQPEKERSKLVNGKCPA